ncbi:uncharacterized protein LOC112463924 isoform X1 [Temnothorax curvispinosus]|uniref:Uncharacterized protein LOC112463924 isoform X1 n=1 Tax=Temnothorax curvispinosus TaxID=300111 RepID=A0A6J1QUZ0_9HYME|nr:uncharacterized protein LOC112463924 isoform X1 [Temnothorax curvispinosus]
MSKMREAAIVKTKNLGNYQQTLKAHSIEHKQRVTMPSKEIILLGQGDSIEVTVKKTKGQKRTSPVANFNSEQKAEKKRSTINDNKSPQKWGNIFREQNLIHMTKEQSTKHDENREAKKNTSAKTQQSTGKHPMKSDEKHLKTSPCCSITLVRDCAVQCTIYNPEIHNSNKPIEFNSAHVVFNKLHMLGLIKQLQDSVNKKDKRTCEIFAEMEQTLQKIPDLKSSAVPKESSKEMKTMYDLFMIEREKLQSELQNREEKLKKANKTCSELAFNADVQRQQLDTATREKNDMTSVITELRQHIKDKERIITDLNNKQTELAQNYVDSKLEIDKLTALSSCKDTLITEYRSTITELQNQIANQLKILNEICMKEGSTSPQMSFIHTGHACSSPTSTDDSSQSLDDISVSSVNSVCEEHARRKDAPVEDPELVSLLDGESSHTIMPDQNEVTNAKRSAMQNNTVRYQNMDTNNMIGKKSLRHSSKKGRNKENDTYKTRKFAKPKEKQNDNIRKLYLNTSKALESITSTKSTISGIRKQGDVQNRKPVNIPSPLRNCPHPDWSDSSLPSISTVSNLDMMIPNDV